MDCPYCRQPILTPVWECHAEQDFCSIECGMMFVIGDPIPRPTRSVDILPAAEFEFTYRADEFAAEYVVGPFIVSNDVVNDWQLFFNHKQHGYIHIADLNRLVSIAALIRSGDIQIAISFLFAAILDRGGMIVSRGHWSIGPVHIYCDDGTGWSWGIKTETQHT